MHNEKMKLWGFACSCGRAEFGFVSQEDAGWVASGHDLDADEPTAGDGASEALRKKTT